MKLHHIGIASENIEKQIEHLEQGLGIRKKSAILYDALQDAELCMLELEDGSRIELVSGNAVKSYLKKRIFQYHLCYEVHDIDAEIQKWLDLGAKIIQNKKPAILFDNRPVAFVYTQIGLIELLGD